MEHDDGMIKVDLLDVLLDENNTAPIYVYDEDGVGHKYEQVAIIPNGEDLYAVLSPYGVSTEGEEVVEIFHIVCDEETDEAMLVLETDEEMVDYIFNKFKELVEESTNYQD